MKVKNKSTRRKVKHHKNKSRKGGNVIGSGGFGCVFRPALKCSKKKQRKTNMVSKLMTRKHAKKEYSTIKEIKKKLKTIPQYSDYFLVYNVSTCNPSQLTKSDLSNFDEKCKVMKKYDDITSENVNENLSKLMLLNLPDGGISLTAYYNNMKSKADFKFINEQLQNLLLKGVIPMNKMGVYHGDIKEGNILFNLNSQKIGLIDWGLSFYTKSQRPRIPKLLKNKPLQYNLPFSIILFNKTFESMFIKFAKTHYSSDELHEFMNQYIELWIIERGKGHMDVIEDIWRIVSNEKDVDITRTFIVPFLCEIVTKYKKSGKFDKNAYFRDIFLPNLDVWGMLMSYSVVLENNSFNYGRRLADLYYKFLYSTPTTIIDTNELINELNNI